MLRSSYIVVFGQLSAVILIIVSYFVLERKVSLGESEISVPPAREEVTLIRKDTMHFYYVLASFICVTGLLVSSLYGRYIDQGERHDLLARASYIANATNAADLSSLSGTESDLGSNSYLRLKQFLYDTRSANADVRFLYYFRSNGEKLFFLVDSEFPSSADYSPPGQVYEETSELEFNNYNNQVSFVEGPYSDSWGTWISAYAPVIYNGEQVGQFGMDIDASKWKMLIWQKMFYIVLAGVVAAAVALYAGYRRTYR